LIGFEFRKRWSRRRLRRPFQIGTTKYGVPSADGRLDEVRLSEIAALPQVKMFELKLSQGAKPAKGEILPAANVTPEIAKFVASPFTPIPSLDTISRLAIFL
jgi:glutamate synthase domain-containing protein 2